MAENITKMIIVEYCDTCPYEGTCKPWKALTAQQRVKLTIGVGVGQFILKGCPLPDKPDMDAPASTSVGIFSTKAIPA